MYPADGAQYGDLRDALEKLQLNDASLFYEPETSAALGFGFRCGFLGLLHLEIIQERLEREYNLDLVTTAPSVIYKVHKTDGTVIDLTNPSNLPDPSEIDYMEEPLVKAEIMVTTDYIGPIMELCQQRRGQYQGIDVYKRQVILYVRKRKREMNPDGAKRKGAQARRRERMLFGITMFFACVLLFYRPRETFSITALDVGQGDALVVESGRFLMLNDGGSSSASAIGEKGFSRI